MSQAKRRDRKHQVRRNEQGEPLQDNLLPQSQNVPTFPAAGIDDTAGEGPTEATVQSEEIRMTGAGTGGATQSDGRPGLLYEGANPPQNQPNS